MNDGPVLAFTGALRDCATFGIALGNGYRWYLPALMRFTAPDSLSPFGAAGPNPYIYCNDDPINRRDPTGHIAWFAAANDVRMFVTREAARDDDRAISAREPMATAEHATASGREPGHHVSVPREQAPANEGSPQVERTMMAAKKPISYRFYFVEGAVQEIETREGKMKALRGDAVVTGRAGEQWPIPRADFDARYSVVDFGLAVPNAIPVIAEQMSTAFRIKPHWSEEWLLFEAKDIRVKVVGDPNNSWGVGNKIFFETYDVFSG
ncbi:RHS repeat-associated core domain-containing protein [Trinickia sp. NRRL B-1857]|uniref:RHS repeat-associated core domain-containing protein n=1 Tax=Trinickia sp. NRRL B-1857 TaxID=3162879 RepID=UPI003D2DA4E8